MNEHIRERFEVQKKVEDVNAYYYFNYPLVDLVLDMLLIKHFINFNISKKENHEYNKDLNLVKYFYSLVLNSLKEILTPNRWDRIRKDIQKEKIIEKVFIPQWFEKILLDYIKMSKSKRQREIMHVLDEIIHYLDYDEYDLMLLDLEKISKEKNRSIDDFHYDFPEKVEW